MPKKKLTRNVAQEVAGLLAEDMIKTLAIEPYKTGKNQGKLFAQYTLYDEPNSYVTEGSKNLALEALESAYHDIAHARRFNLRLYKTETNKTIFVSHSQMKQSL